MNVNTNSSPSGPGYSFPMETQMLVQFSVLPVWISFQMQQPSSFILWLFLPWYVLLMIFRLFFWGSFLFILLSWESQIINCPEEPVALVRCFISLFKFIFHCRIIFLWCSVGFCCTTSWISCVRMCAKSLQSCPSLYNTMDWSLPGSSV